MKQMIYKDDAIKAIDDLPNAYNGWSDAYDKALIIETLEEVPAVEPKRGEWIVSEVRFGNYRYQCKECGWYENHAYNDVKPHNFCPNCGAKMKGADDE